MTFDIARPPEDLACTGVAGDTTWLGYENIGGGFAPVPTAWPIPFRALRASEQGDASAAIALHASYDLDGDRAGDFVQTFERDGPVEASRVALPQKAGGASRECSRAENRHVRSYAMEPARLAIAMQAESRFEGSEVSRYGLLTGAV